MAKKTRGWKIARDNQTKKKGKIGEIKNQDSCLNSFRVKFGFPLPLFEL